MYRRSLIKLSVLLGASGFGVADVSAPRNVYSDVPQYFEEVGLGALELFGSLAISNRIAEYTSVSGGLDFKIILEKVDVEEDLEELVLVSGWWVSETEAYLAGYAIAKHRGIL